MRALHSSPLNLFHSSLPQVTTLSGASSGANAGSKPGNPCRNYGIGTRMSPKNTNGTTPQCSPDYRKGKGTSGPTCPGDGARGAESLGTVIRTAGLRFRLSYVFTSSPVAPITKPLKIHGGCPLRLHDSHQSISSHFMR